MTAPIWKPRVYFAGKIGQNDWRHKLVPGLRSALYEDGPFDAGKFIYAGPYFVSCDHGCHHGPTTHGVLSVGGNFGDPCFQPNKAAQPDRREVARRAMEGVRTSQLVFVYVGAPDCIGTMVEIGIAISLGIPVALCIDSNIDESEFWFPAALPGVTLFPCIIECHLPRLLDAALRTLLVHAWREETETIPVESAT